MSSVKKPRKGTSAFYCTACDKHAFATRADARARMKAAQRDGDGGMNTYRCPHRPDYWHFGHPAEGQRNGTDRVVRPPTLSARGLAQLHAMAADTIPEPDRKGAP